jgi:hypothetical protein
MVELIDALDAPLEIRRAAMDALQHFVWAQDCRRQCYAGGGARWRSKANTAHGKGIRAYRRAEAWVMARPTPTTENP